MNETNQEAYMKRLYYNPKTSAYLSGETSLFHAMRKKFPTIKREKIAKFLMKQKIYNLFTEKNKRKRKLYTKYVTSKPFQSMSCDLFFGKGHKNIFLMCADDFTNYRLGQFVGHRKTAKATTNAMAKILTAIPKKMHVNTIRTDYGSEYAGFEKFLKDKDIKYVPLKSYFKAYNAEKMIRDVRQVLKRYSQKYNKKVSPKIIKTIIRSLNNRHNRIMKMSSIDALNVENYGKVFERKFGSYIKAKRDNVNIKEMAKYRRGDKVRVLAYRNIIEERSQLSKKPTRYSTTIFRVFKPIPETYPIQYFLIDENSGQFINKRFLESHLIPIDEK